MDVSELLCVGRNEMTGFGIETRRKLFPESHVDEETEDNENSKFVSHQELIRGLSKREIKKDSAPSSRRSSHSSNSPAKSILRASIASPKSGGSPSSVRSVRFTDDDSNEENDSIFAKLHVNRSTQTGEHCKRESIRLKCDESDLEQRKTNEKCEMKATKTEHKTVGPLFGACISPRPSVTSLREQSTQMEVRNHSPERHSDGKKSDTRTMAALMCMAGGEKIIQNLSIKKSKTEHVPKSTGESGDGSKIIQNMSLTPKKINKSVSTQTVEIPDGNKIIQNMDLSNSLPRVDDAEQCVFKETVKTVDSVATQTTDIPNGNKIVQNMEVGSPMAWNILAMQGKEHDGTKIVQNMPLPPKVKSVSIQTSDQPDEHTIVQNTIIDSPRPSHSSIAQMYDNDGNRIIQNMSICSPKIATPDLINSGTIPETRRDSIDSISSSCDSWEPVLIYGQNQASSTPRVASDPPQNFDIQVAMQNAHIQDNRKTYGKLVDRSARTILEREMFQTKTKCSSMITDAIPTIKTKSNHVRSPYGLKYDSHSALASTLTLKDAISNSATSHTLTKKAETKRSEYFASSYKTDQFNHKDVNTRQASSVNKHRLVDAEKQIWHGQDKSKTESLKFTPIETHSFKPGSVTALQKSKLLEHSNSKESITKNSFVKGMDLGPAPKMKSSRGINIRPDSYGSPRERMVQPVAFNVVPRTTSATVSAYKYTLSEQSEQSRNMHSGSFKRKQYANMPTSPRSYTSSSANFTHMTTNTRTSTSPSTNCARNTASVSQIKSKQQININPSWPLTANLHQMRNTAIRKTTVSANSAPVKTYQKKRSSENFVDQIYHETTDTFSSSDMTHAQRSHTTERQSRSKERIRGQNGGGSVKEKDRSRSASPTLGYVEKDKPTYLESLNDSFNVRPIQKQVPNVNGSIQNRSPTSRSQQMSASLADLGYSATEYQIVNKRPNSSPDRRQKPPIKGKPPLPSFPRAIPLTDRTKYILNRSTNIETRPTADQPKDIVHNRSMSPVANEKLTNIVHTRHDFDPEISLNGSSLSHDRILSSQTVDTKRTHANKESTNIVTIGKAPDGLMDSSCVFLGDETIQKIIEEANL